MEIFYLKEFLQIVQNPAQVRDKVTGELVQNLTSPSPRFLVSDLPPANLLAGLNLTVYTASLGGRVNTVESLGVFTSKVGSVLVGQGQYCGQYGVLY